MTNVETPDTNVSIPDTTVTESLCFCQSDRYPAIVGGKMLANEISVASMMDCANRHDRYFLRLIAPDILLYKTIDVSSLKPDWCNFDFVNANKHKIKII